MNTEDVKYVTKILKELKNYFRDELDGPMPIDIAVQIKRNIRNIDEVIEITEEESGP